MRKAAFWAFLLLLASVLLGGTVFRDQVAGATGLDRPATPVLEQNIDANGFIRVHEQGPTQVTGIDTANQHLANIDSQTAKLTFDGSGNLKTAPQGTQTVHVDNSSIQTAPAKANFSWSHQYDMDAGGFGATTEFQGFGSDVLISLVVVGNADDSVTINFRNDFGFAALFLRGGGEDGSDNFQLPLTQPIEANGVLTRCTNLAESCKFFVSVVGTVVH